MLRIAAGSDPPFQNHLGLVGGLNSPAPCCGVRGQGALGPSEGGIYSVGRGCVFGSTRSPGGWPPAALRCAGLSLPFSLQTAWGNGESMDPKELIACCK